VTGQVDGPPVAIVIGVGNRWRGDDGAGPAVVSHLETRWGDDPRVRLMEVRDDVCGVVLAWDGCDITWIVDATAAASAPGTVVEVEPHRLTGAPPLGGSHRAGVAEAIELGRALERMPKELRVLGIEGGDFADGDRLSPAVSGAVDRVVARLDADLRDRLRAGAAGPSWQA
jgi:hydrogenase maturation protease